MKEEALKLAEQLEDDAKYGECDWTNPKVSADMIRRLVDRIDEMEKYVGFKDSGYDIIQLPSQTKPLSDEEIHDIWKSLWEGGNIGHIAYNYAKAIEERHGIK